MLFYRSACCEGDPAVFLFFGAINVMMMVMPMMMKTYRAETMSYIIIIILNITTTIIILTTTTIIIIIILLISRMVGVPVVSGPTARVGLLSIELHYIQCHTHHTHARRHVHFHQTQVYQIILMMIKSMLGDLFLM